MQFDRVAIAPNLGGTEYVVLEPQLIVDYGEGQGPQGGVITVKDGWIAALGRGEARLLAGIDSPGGDIPPSLILRDSQGKNVVQVSAFDDPSEQSQARVYLDGTPASLHMRDEAGNEHVLLRGDDGKLWLGGKAAGGEVRLFAKGEEDNRNGARATIHLDGDGGSLTLQDKSGRASVSLDGQTGDLHLGGNGHSGKLFLYGPLADQSNYVQAQVRIVDATLNIGGGNGPSGVIYLFKDGADTTDEGQATIQLNGAIGDITLRGADCAERFSVADEPSTIPGTVLVADEYERLISCSEPYDRRVAGVVSGAGPLRPGIILGSIADRRAVPVALVGKTYCKVDTRYGPIACGDLLTTSQTPGHAMRASNRERAFGSVLGKALTSLSTGQGLIPVLVALQ